MKALGFKNYFKSISLGNLSIIDDNSIADNETPQTAHSHGRADKQNLSSINEQKRELHQKLKEFSDLRQRSIENEFDLDSPYLIPDIDVKIIQDNVSKETYQHQSAILELLITEQNFLKQIQFIVKVYISVFEKLMKEFFPKINPNDIFSNLKDVYRVSIQFWKECMQPLVEELVNSKHLLQSRLLKNGFTKIGSILKPYIIYCTEVSTCRSYILALEKGNELFSEYSKWAMEFEESNREMLYDHLAKPFQRLTKYKILLQAIQKHSSENEKSDIQEMIEAVDSFVTRVNEKIEKKNLKRKLLYLSSQIDSYDVIDPLGEDLLTIISQFNKFDLMAPILIGTRKIIRQLSHQGEIKLKEGPSKTVDVKLYLLTDILLITKFKKKTFGKMKIIKPPVVLDKVRFQKLTNTSFACICLNEFNCISALYHFNNNDSRKVDEWLQKLDDAVKHYSNLKPSINDISLPRDFQNSIPQVRVVQSSPQRNRFKQQSNSDPCDSENIVESSFKRKSPVARKHKSKKENILHSVEMSMISPTLERKNSQPTIKVDEISTIRKISKSSSFQERDKQNSAKLSDNSDVDDPAPFFGRYNMTQRAEILPQMATIDNEISDEFAIIKSRQSYMIKSRTEPTAGDRLNKSYSKSLNKLNI